MMHCDKETQKESGIALSLKFHNAMNGPASGSILKLPCSEYRKLYGASWTFGWFIADIVQGLADSRTFRIRPTNRTHTIGYGGLFAKYLIFHRSQSTVYNGVRFKNANVV
jgi:hypothetical protein